MGLFKKKKSEKPAEEKINRDDTLREDISKAYDEIMNNGISEEQQEENKNTNDANIDLETELFKSKIKKFKENKTQEALGEVIKMLQGRKFLLPSVSNMENPFEDVNGERKLKKGAAFNPAFLTDKDNRVFLPVFTDEKAMVQKSPSGVILQFSVEQCVSIVYNKKNPVFAIVINPFTENMVLGEDLLRVVFKETKKEA